MDGLGDLPPVPGEAQSIDDVVLSLGRLRQWAGAPSFTELARMVGELREAQRSPRGRPGRVTVYDCFRTGRSRLDAGLVVDLVTVLTQDAAGGEGAVSAWRAALASVGGSTPAAASPALQVVTSLAPASLFVGRRALIESVAATPRGGAVALTGLPGVGKTELAVQVAQRWVGADAAPVLMADLLGHREISPTLESVVVALALALGLDAASSAVAVASALDERGVVVVLDNVRDAAQVAPLVPRGGGARMILTARRRLPGLVARRFDVAELAPAEAVELLARSGAGDRIGAEPDAAHELVERCLRLPLDLTVLGGALSQRPTWSLADHARRLEALPLDELRRPALTASYRLLAPAVQRVYRLLALSPTPTTSRSAIVALVGLPRSETEACLDRLVVENVLRDVDAERVRMHDVSRSHAGWLLGDEEPWSAQQEAVARLCDELLAGARQRAAVIDPALIDPGAAAAPQDLDAVYRWFAGELGTLLGLADVIAQWDLGDRLADFAICLHAYLTQVGRLPDAARLHERVLAECRLEAHDKAVTHRRLGRVLEMMGRLDDSYAHLQTALRLGIEDDGMTLNGVGNVLKRLGRIGEAGQAYRESVEAGRAAGNPVRVARSLGNLADVTRLEGDFALATAQLAEAAATSEAVGDYMNLAIVLANAANVAEIRGDLDEGWALLERLYAMKEYTENAINRGHADLTRAHLEHRGGDPDRALGTLARTAELARSVGDALLLCDVDVARGRCLLDLGRLDEAERAFTAALDGAREISAGMCEVDAVNGLGTLALRRGQVGPARRLFTEALDLARGSGDRVEQASATWGLALAAGLDGDDVRDALGREALALYAELGFPEAAELAVFLETPRHE